MKRYTIKKVMGGILGATALFGLSACSDDHFDIKPGDPSAANTLWQNIEANPQLDSLAMILKRVKVYTKEHDSNAKKMTYAELLNTSQTLTLWAPLNGTYNAKHYLDELDRVDELNREGKAVEAARLEYDLGVQFAQNHLARFNFESEKGAQEVRLLNGKICTYNAADSIFNGVSLHKGLTNVPASNGTMHVLEGQSPFAYNVFDYMAAHADIFQNVYGTLSDPEIDKRVFSEALSIPGAMNENGEMVYVDSVYYTDNELLTYSNAQIDNEDSLYIAVIPTDQAWEQAVKKVESLFNYGESYNYNYSLSTNNFGPTELVLNAEGADSLSKYNLKRQLITSMYFTPSIFGQEFDRNDIEGLVNYAYNADSLISTNYVTYYNPTPGQKNPLFGDVEPVKASNGIIFPITEYNLSPSYSFVARQLIDMTNTYNFGKVSNNDNGEKGQTITLQKDLNWDEAVDISELGDEKRYTYFSASGNMTIYVPLPNLYSTKYRIKIQMVPNGANTNNKWYTTDGEEYPQATTFYAELRDDKKQRIGNRSEKVTVENDAVKTYTLWESIEIPKCYVNMPAGVSNCYPLLYITYNRTDQTPRPSNVPNRTYGLGISKIIVEPVRD